MYNNNNRVTGGGCAINGTAAAAAAASSSSMNRNSGGGVVSVSIATSNHKTNFSAPPSSSNNNHHHHKKTTTAFYPKLIASQIVALQCFHYFVLSICFQINNVLYGTPITIDRIFTDRYVRYLWHGKGWPDACAILVSSAVGAVLLVVIVEKSKKCLDFSVTLFFVHLVFSTMYNHGIPKAIEWWLVHVAGTILMVVLGEYLCSRREMEDIPLLHL